MAMKYIRLLQNPAVWPTKVRMFKWEWAIEYEYNVNGMGLWKYGISVFPNRKNARIVLANMHFDERTRDMKLKRRLVQAHWENYNDSFTWNRGCGR